MAFCLLSCGEKKDTAAWTILIYMAADNGLNNNALEDIQEMTTAQFSDEINVIVQIDESEDSASPAAKRYKILPGKQELISDLGEIDSGDPATLTHFADWGFDKYPAEGKALFIWGHGNGWYDAYNKFCPDHESSSSISVPDGEFYDAMHKIDAHLDILGLDACNMLTLEVLNEIYFAADYIIGSEAVIPADGSPYNEFLNLWEDHVSVEALVQDLAYAFVNSYSPGGSQNPYFTPYEISFGVVNTAVFQDLISAISSFVTTWQDSTHTDIFRQSRQDCTITFNDLEADIDVTDYFTKLQENAENEVLITDCQNILHLLDQVFIGQYYIDLHDPNGTQDYPAGTASIWFPTVQTTFENLLFEYDKLAFTSSGWQNYIRNSFPE